MVRQKEGLDETFGNSDFPETWRARSKNIRTAANVFEVGPSDKYKNETSFCIARGADNVSASTFLCATLSGNPCIARTRGKAGRNRCGRSARQRGFVYHERPEQSSRANDARGKRVAMDLRLRPVLGTLLVLMIPVLLWAGDTSALRPPKGSAVALVAFEDLQCPDCADADPLLIEASTKYDVPLVRRDFPLPMHNWSFEAHVMARYFDTKKDAQGKDNAKALPLGEQFRRWVYANQKSINKENLRGMAARFADQHGLELPENYDPKGEFKKLVLADYALGQQVGVIHTPTVFVVSVSQRGAPFVETLDREKLFAMIEQMLAAEKK